MRAGAPWPGERSSGGRACSITKLAMAPTSSSANTGRRPATVASRDGSSVAKATTSYARATTEVTFDPRQTSLETLLSAIERAGFKGLPA